MARKELIKTIITDSQAKQLPALWSRVQVIPPDTNKIITLTGVRRSGKTYHLFEIMKKLLDSGVSADRMLYINFEDERLHLKGDEMDMILEAYRELHPELDLSKCYFFFDEIQEVDGWEHFVDRLSSSISTHIFVTGSNSKLLSREIATALRGRTLTFEVYPLSFYEFVTITQPNLDPYNSADRARLVSQFSKFLEQGGFPAIARQSDEDLRQMELQGYFDVMLLRDLVERYNVSSVAILKFFCKRIIAASAGEFSVNKIYNELKSSGYKVSKNTLYNYQDNVEAIYLSRFVSKYDESLVKSENSIKKPYVIDHGLGAALNYKLSRDTGRMLETVVALELMKQGKQIYYYQDSGAECDFVSVDRGQVIEAIQVTYNMSDEQTRKRELRGLVQCCRRLGLTKATILTYDTEESLEVDDIQIQIMPVWRYSFDFEKERQAQRVRDAHYYEDGVRQNGTGGVPPQEG